MSDRHYFQQIVELSEDCVKEMDVEGRVLSINGHGLTLLQYPSEHDLIGKSWWSLWPEETQPAIRAAVETATQGRTTRLTAPCPTFLGEERWWQVSVGPLIDEEGQIRAVLAVSRDITESRKVEMAQRLLSETLRTQLTDAVAIRETSAFENKNLIQQLRRASNQQATLNLANVALQSRLDLSITAQAVAEMAVQQAQKGEAIGQLVSGVAHDFNNMLQVCISSLSVLADNPKNLDDRQKKLMNYALDAAWHAGKVAKRLLGFSRAHPYLPEPMRLDEMIADMVEFIQHSLGSGIHVTCARSPEPLCIVADAHSIEQCLMNLCINARDACHGTGEITVSFGTQHIDKADATVEKPSGHYGFVEVKDNGEGMSPETLERIFEPFFTTKPEGMGTGLGLAQIYGSMRKAGGFVEVESDRDEGTAFRLVFPLVDEIECA